MSIEVFSFQHGQGYIRQGEQRAEVTPGPGVSLLWRMRQAVTAIVWGARAGAKYHWVITEDMAPHESGNRVLQHGPEPATDRCALSKVVKEGEHFRLLDASGQEKLSGFITGRFSGLEPLQDYGRRFGCTRIEYKRSGKWVRAGRA